MLDRSFWEYIPPRQNSLHNDKEILLKGKVSLRVCFADKQMNVLRSDDGQTWNLHISDDNVDGEIYQVNVYKGWAQQFSLKLELLARKH